MRSRSFLSDFGEVLLVVLVAFLFGAASVLLQVEALALIGTFAVALMVWMLLRNREEGFGDLGLRRPASWLVAVMLALTAAVAALAASLLVLAITGFRPDLGRIAGVGGDLPALLWAILLLGAAVVAAEIVFRGFLITRLATALGSSRLAWSASVVLAAVLYGLLHAAGGELSMLFATLFGLLLGSIYVGTRRSLWAPILTHGLAVLLALLFFYLGLDRYVL